MNYKLTFKNFARLVFARQVKKQADTFVIIYGLPRTGKTTLGFHLAMAYIDVMKEMYKKGKSTWEVPSRWSQIFRNYFATSCLDMIEKLKNNPKGSFVFIDEGLDLVSWHERLTTEQKDLIELIQKTGSKLIFTILITPSISLLTKEILARAHYLFIIPTEPDGEKNTAYIFKNYTIPFMAEKHPFALEGILRDLEKNPYLGSDINTFLSYLRDRRRLVGVITFRKIDEKIYNLYEKMIKEPSIMRERQRRRMVSYSKFFKTKYMLETILFNLYTKDNKSIAQLRRLLIDKFGNELASPETIKNAIDRLALMEKTPEELSEKEEEILEVEKQIEIKPEEDIEIKENTEEY